MYMGQYFSYFFDENPEFNKYGWKPDSPDHRDKYIHYNLISDIEDCDLRDEMPGIYDQKEIGSSVANAVAAAYEYNQIKLDDNHIFIPSRLFIYYNTRKIEKTLEYDAGAQIRNTIKSLNINGICSETKWNYDPSLINFKPYDNCYTAIQPLKYYRIHQNIESLKACLTNGVPFIFGFSVFENFEELNEENMTLQIPKKEEEYIGGQCVLCVGFDEVKKIFIIRNSFGVEWGNKGYFYMDYDYLLNENLCRDFWIIS